MGASLEKFKKSLALAQSLYELDKLHFNNPPKIEDQPNVQGLRGGAVVLSVAALENYLRILFETELGKLSTNPPPVAFENLPDKMQVSSLYFSLERAMKGPKYGENIPKKDRIADIIAASRTAGHIINPRDLSDTGSNPNSQRVKTLFSDIGFSDLYVKIYPDFEIKWGKPEAANFIADKLDEIVNRRHIVAHTANALDISRSDLLETFRFLLIFAELLEKHLTDYIDNLIP